MLNFAQSEARARDIPQLHTLTEVSENSYEGYEGWTLGSGSTGFALSKENADGRIPKVGDKVALYVHRGSMIRGMDLNNYSLYYHTDEELEALRIKERDEMNQRKLDELNENRAIYELRFNDLPAVFQRRISWFRRHNVSFDRDFLDYELMTCEEAVRIAKACPTPVEVEAFREMPNKLQLKKVPGMDRGHSGNSFGMACQLADAYVRDPLLVVAVHGAMVGLTGCEDYGCFHPREDDVMAAIEAVMVK